VRDRMCNMISLVTLEIFMVMKIQVIAFWVMTPCSDIFHAGWVPCHHSMVRPQIADEGKSSGYGG
jgi:hypothetical protein